MPLAIPFAIESSGAEMWNRFFEEMDFGSAGSGTKSFYHGYKSELRPDNSLRLTGLRSRLASVRCIAKGDVPQNTGLHGRQLTSVDGGRALIRDWHHV